jgi:hypothetical protein
MGRRFLHTGGGAVETVSRKPAALLSALHSDSGLSRFALRISKSKRKYYSEAKTVGVADGFNLFGFRSHS